MSVKRKEDTGEAAGTRVLTRLERGSLHALEPLSIDWVQRETRVNDQASQGRTIKHGSHPH
jgi:hypothetical protein